MTLTTRDPYKLLSIFLCLLAFGALLSYEALEEGYSQSHRALEILGGIIILATAHFIYTRQTLTNISQNRAAIICLSLLPLGLLNILGVFEKGSGSIAIDNAFALFISGAISLVILLPDKIASVIVKRLRAIMVIEFCLVAAIVILYKIIPLTITMNIGLIKSFTFLGSIFMLTSGLYFATEYFKNRNNDNLSFVAMFMIFVALSGVLSLGASSYNTAYIGQHIFRLCSHLILAIVLFENPVRKKISLYYKIIALVALAAIFTALTVEGAFYYKITKSSFENEAERINSEIKLLTPLFKMAFDEVRDDAKAIYGVPPVSGIVRAMENGGIDPVDNSTLEQWRKRLAIIFTSKISNKINYNRIRFVGMDDGGREIVRVERKDDGSIVTLNGKDLKRKGTRPFFAEGTGLIPNVARFSSVSLIDQGDAVDLIDAKSPVIRVLMSIYGSDNKQRGILVVNVVYEKIFSRIFKNLEYKRDIYVIDDGGNVLVKRNSEKSWEYYSSDSDDYRKKNIAQIADRVMKSPLTVESYIGNMGGEKSFISYGKVRPDGSNYNRFIALAISSPVSYLVAQSVQTRNEVMMFGTVTIIAASFIAALFASFIISPLKQMTVALKSYTKSGNSFDFTVNSYDEIGNLATAFKDLLQKLEDSRKQEQLSLSRLKAIIDNSSDGFIGISSDGAIISYNKAAATMFGYAEYEVIGSDVGILITEFSEHDDDLDLKKMINSDNKIMEFEGRRKNGETFPMEFSISEVHLDDGIIYSSILRDITERKLAENDILKSMKALEDSNRELDDFAYIASHDLKEPLRGLSSNAQFLQEDWGDVLDDSGKRKLARMRQLCDRLETLINDLLYFSRLGRREMAMQKTNLNEVIESIREIMAETIVSQNVDIVIEGVLPIVVCDKSRITELFRNLISNAIKYNKNDKKIIRIGTEPAARFPQAEGAQYVFYVADNGIGIDSMYYKDIFRIFKRLNNEDESVRGSGVGLTFVQKIVQRHGGNIWLASEIGVGTTFYFTLKGAGENNLSKRWKGENNG